jgi:hypothetical protein
VENLFTPRPDQQAAHAAKVAALAEVIRTAAPDVVASQEFGDPESFERFGPGSAIPGPGCCPLTSRRRTRSPWAGCPPCLCRRWRRSSTCLPTSRRSRSPTTDGISFVRLGHGALAGTYAREEGVRIRALPAHFKCKLLSFPAARFDTTDEHERARYAVYALDRRAAEAAAVRGWVTRSLTGNCKEQPLLVCGELNDTMDAPRPSCCFGPPGSQLGTAGDGHPDRGDSQRLWDVRYAMKPPNEPCPTNTLRDIAG